MRYGPACIIFVVLNNKKMKKEKTITLYAVSCGLYAEDSLFPPFSNVSGDYVTDLNLALETYNSITAQSFDKKEVLLARMKGYKTYNKTVLCAEMPISIYEDLCIRDDDQELLSKEEAQERTNEYVWHQSVKFLDNIKDEVFEIEGGISSLHITNVRKWTEENTIMQHV